MSASQQDQDRLYQMLEKLQEMTKEIPLVLQQRLSSELLASLATCLVESGGQIFEIVQMLTEVQNATEKQLFRQRVELQRKLQDEKMSFDTRYRDSVSSESDPEAVLALTAKLDAEKEQIKSNQEEEMRKMDTNLVLQLDQKVTEQQLTLERAGVPGFRVTNNPTEIKVQMHVVDFIRRLNPNGPKPSQ